MLDDAIRLSMPQHLEREGRNSEGDLASKPSAAVRKVSAQVSALLMFRRVNTSLSSLFTWPLFVEGV
jgi:hypothetical protein